MFKFNTVYFNLMLIDDRPLTAREELLFDRLTELRAKRDLRRINRRTRLMINLSNIVGKTKASELVKKHA